MLDGNYSFAKEQGIRVLKKCLDIDEDAYRQIHKGTPFYWIGTAAFLEHDYETVVFFYDAAVSEDIRSITNNSNNTPTPALCFIQIQGNQPAQAARELVQKTECLFDDIISVYNNRSERPVNIAIISLGEIRTNFLQLAVSPGREGWRTLATALISFCLEGYHLNGLLDLRTSNGTAEPFFMHLFKGCVLFESLLKSNIKKRPSENSKTLSDVLKDLSNELNMQQPINISSKDFGMILSDLTNADDSIQTAIIFTGKVRNTVGHNLGWQVQINKQQYETLFQMIASSCIHAIARLYCP